MNYLMFAAPAGALIALSAALMMAFRVKKSDRGNEKMIKISDAIKQGANAYLKRQYKNVAVFFGIIFIILLVLDIFGLVPKFLPIAFVTGGFFSGLSGFIGMKIATSANSRTAAAAQKSLNSGLKVAFSAGSVMGFTVVGLGLLDISIWFFF